MNGRTPEAQAFRAERVIAAAATLAAAGGYDAVQMREVARMAELSLATLYRYYPSKDELMRAVIAGEVSRLREDMVRRPPTQRSAHGRASEVFVRSFRAMRMNRGFAHAAMCSYNVPLPFDHPQVDEELSNNFVDIAAYAAWGPDHRTTKSEYRALHMLQSLWGSSIISWLNGYMSPEYVEGRLRFAAQRLLEPSNGGTGRGKRTR